MVFIGCVALYVYYKNKNNKNDNNKNNNNKKNKKNKNNKNNKIKIMIKHIKERQKWKCLLSYEMENELCVELCL